MKQSLTNPDRRWRRSIRFALLLGFLFAPCVLDGQSLPAPPRPLSSPPATAKGEFSAEEIFKRFASRILFLTCVESADESGLASGVLVSSDGLIVTNGHVVEKCRSMTATFISGSTRRAYEPVLKYYDAKSDTAVLQIAAKGLDFFSIPTRPARVGERVYSIGNPRGLEQSISEGIVSGNRQEDGVSWIQHSAPISPGSSGGALISSRGELVGINSYLLRESQNLNFAVPADTLAKALSGARAVTGVLRMPPGADAQFRLGLLNYNGKDIPQDYREAAVWFRAAAEQGYAEAAFQLGKLYEDGHGVAQNYTQAAAWYRKAAEQGDADAQGNLGTLYANGHGVAQNYTQAAAWYRKAAEQGDASAQFILGALYRDGHGVARDYGEAYFWVRLAAAGTIPGLEPAEMTRLLEIFASYLTAEELAKEQQRAREWLSAHAPRSR